MANLLNNPYFKIPNGSNFAVNTGQYRSTGADGWFGASSAGLPAGGKPPLPDWLNPQNIFGQLTGLFKNYLGQQGALPTSAPTGRLNAPALSVPQNISLYNPSATGGLPPSAAARTYYGGGVEGGLMAGGLLPGQPRPPAAPGDYYQRQQAQMAEGTPENTISLEEAIADFNQSRATGREAKYMYTQKDWAAIDPGGWVAGGGRGAGMRKDSAGNVLWGGVGDASPGSQENYRYYGEGKGYRGRGDNRWWIKGKGGGGDGGGGNVKPRIRPDSVSGFALNWRIGAG